MKERPILFSGAMVRAILAGTKTQTRRAVKPQPPAWAQHYWGAQGTYSGVAEPRHYWSNYPTDADAFDADADFHIWPGVDKSDEPSDDDVFGAGGFESPYGSEENCLKAADRLWVRETYTLDDDGHSEWAVFRADGFPLPALPPSREPARWRPSIHMPRWASRILLEITGVRVERLQDISEADAIAEGVNSSPGCRQNDDTAAFNRIGPVANDSFPIARYAALWESINGPGSWGKNPWVWVVEFKRVATEVKP